MNFKNYKIGAVVLVMILLGSTIIIPSTGAINIKNINELISKILKNKNSKNFTYFKK